MNFTYPELLKCAQRELKMREYVYPKRIESGKMDKEEAEREMAMMQEIAEILEYLSQPRLQLDLNA